MMQPINIAFAEDQHSTRESTAFFLQKSGVNVVLEADHGKEMLDKLRNSEQLPELVLIDRSMPKMDGLTLLQEIKAVWPKLPCVMFSQHVVEITIKNALHAGAGAYISKNDDSSDELLKAIVHTVNLGHYYSSRASKELFHAAKNLHKPKTLTSLELRYCQLVVQGLTNDAIALRLGCHIKSVESTARRCFGKLEVTHRTALAVALIERGIVALP